VSAANAPPDARGGGPPKTFRASVTIVNRRGLHARAAAKFVKVAEQFAADVEVVKDDMVVCGISIMGLMVLAAGLGTQLEIRARGREAEAAVRALVGLVEGGFDEN
jgi:phosphocarrier protein HPr